MSAHDGGQLDPETRALLAKARDMHEPDGEQRARVLKGLEVSLAAAATTGIASSTLAMATKTVVTVLALGVASTGAWVAVSSRPVRMHHAPARVEQVTAPAAAAPAVAVQEAAEQPEAEPAREEPSASPEPRPHRRHRRSPKHMASLQAETELLREVNSAATIAASRPASCVKRSRPRACSLCAWPVGARRPRRRPRASPSASLARR